MTDGRLFRLDYGEAHIAIRAGATPDDPDNVVQPLSRVRHALYASKSYAQKHGLPRDENDFAAHRFVCAESDAMRAPFYMWLRARIDWGTVAFSGTESAALETAVQLGTGLGFMPCYRASQNSELIEVLPSKSEWDAPLWMVTHVDLHRTRKVQSFLNHLKEEAKSWQL